MRIADIENPTVPYFRGNFAPVQVEHNEPCTEISGEIPTALNGAFLRIGANPVFVNDPESYHPFAGDGMIHEVVFDQGRVTYVNRFVETQGHLAEQELGRVIWDGLKTAPEDAEKYGPSKNIANTAMIFHAGKFLALQEGAHPFHLKLPNLDPVGETDYEGRLNHPFSAHPKIDPRTGELVTYGYNVMSKPHCCVSLITEKGELVHTTGVDIPKPVMMHDCAISSNHTILMDLPCVFDFTRMAEGKSMLYFEPENGSRFGILERGAEGSEVRWFDVASCYCYHTVNAFEEGDEVVVEGCRSERNSIGDEERPKKGDRRDLPMLHQWRFNLKTGEVRERALDSDWGSEFARINEDYIGVRNQFTYAARIAGDTLESGFDGIVKYDLVNGSSMHYPYGPGRLGGEPIFAPKPGGENEDDGWVIGFVWDEQLQHSECIVLDAARFEEGPIARVVMPARVPFGFHSAWVDRNLWEAQQ
ncbi:MAG: carotenoid oxygenase family protein [Gammaproteobacteria bacterium]|nr:carotenoid oxygenase family protein [Gammaproteobacteria bacterium]